MDVRVQAQLTQFAATLRAAERDMRIATVDAIAAGVATKSQVSRHTGVSRSTIDRWLRDPAGTAQVKVDAAVELAQLLDTALPSLGDIDAGRALEPEGYYDADDVFVELWAGTQAEPGARVSRAYVGTYRDAAKVVGSLVDQLGAVQVGGGAVRCWVDEIPRAELIPF